MRVEGTEAGTEDDTESHDDDSIVLHRRLVHRSGYLVIPLIRRKHTKSRMLAQESDEFHSPKTNCLF